MTRDRGSRATGFDSWRPHDRPLSKVRILIAMALAIAVAALLIARAQAEEPGAQHPQLAQCLPVTVMHDRLKAVYDEQQLAYGLMGNGVMLELWASPGGETWSVLLVSTEGMSCLTASGHPLKFLRPKVVEVGKPS
jgi:hypothetical protein